MQKTSHDVQNNKILNKDGLGIADFSLRQSLLWLTQHHF